MDKEEKIIKRYRLYLIFMLIACGGAFIWQFCFPQLGGMFTSWGNSIGWQKEISLWNIGLIASIIIALKNKNLAVMKILVIQSTVLCWLLGINHLISLSTNFSYDYIIHILGIFEVMLLGGIWGTYLLIKNNK